MAKLQYFTNLDFPEKRECPFLSYLWGEVVWGREQIWPECYGMLPKFRKMWVVLAMYSLVSKWKSS